MAAPSTAILDAFNRANGGLGASWTTYGVGLRAQRIDGNATVQIGAEAFNTWTGLVRILASNDVFDGAGIELERTSSSGRVTIIGGVPLTISNGGLNVGTATGAGAGEIVASGQIRSTGSMIAGTNSSPAYLVANGPAANNHGWLIQTGGLNRWVGESIAADGENFYLSRFNDAGAYAGSPLTISRATGNIGIEALPVVGERLRIRGGGNGTSYTLVTQSNAGSSTFGVRDDGMVYVRDFLDLQARTAPAAGAGARIFLDSADGDLKVTFPNGTTRTLATN